MHSRRNLQNTSWGTPIDDERDQPQTNEVNNSIRFKSSCIPPQYHKVVQSKACKGVTPYMRCRSGAVAGRQRHGSGSGDGKKRARRNMKALCGAFTEFLGAVRKLRNAASVPRERNRGFVFSMFPMFALIAAALQIWTRSLNLSSRPRAVNPYSR